MFLPLTGTLVSAPGLAVFLVASSSFFTWATASIMPLNKRALNRIRFISDVVPFLGSIQRARRLPPQDLQVKLAPARRPIDPGGGDQGAQSDRCAEARFRIICFGCT